MDLAINGAASVNHGTRAKRADKLKPTRKDPEKRRQQNLRAQKKYREKQKRHVQELEAWARSSLESPQIGPPLQPPPVLEKIPEDDLLNRDFLYGSTSTSGTMPDDYSWLSQGHDMWIETDPAARKGSGLRAPAAIGPSVTAVAYPGMDLISLNSNLLPLLDCGCNILHIRLPIPARLRAKCSIHAANVLANPYRNAIRFEIECIVSAFVRNCLAIGISREMWCEEHSVSPFFRPASESSLLPSAALSGSMGLVHTVQAIFKTLKPDLRPCPEQVLVSHHPCIDIMPFPALRASWIMNMGLFDEDEFFYDTLNGFICWSGSSSSRNHGVFAGSGTPWEARNWEAKEWFIQKWMFLLGGEDSELVRQSRWWRSMRGEEDL